MMIVNSQKANNKKLQVNIDRNIAEDAENVINKLGLTPTIVINALYHEIAATARIPLSFTVTPEQRTELHIRQLAANKSVKKIHNQKELKEFFDED